MVRVRKQTGKGECMCRTCEKTLSCIQLNREPEVPRKMQSGSSPGTAERQVGDFEEGALR